MKKLLYTLATVSTLLLVGCTDAGKDQDAATGNKITLDGSKSKTDMGGKITAYSWSQIEKAGVPTVHIFNRHSAVASFVAPSVKEQTDIKFKLTTTESYHCKNEQDSSCRHHKSSKKMTVTVSASDSNSSGSRDDYDNYSVTVSGGIKNTSNGAVSSATITANGKTVTSRSNGRYSIAKIQAGQRVVVNVSHPDYFDHSRIVLPNYSNNFNQDFTLYNAAKTVSFRPRDGAVVSHNGASITFAENSKFLNSKKKSYKGNVIVKIRYVGADKFAFPGGYEGADASENFLLKLHALMYATISAEDGSAITLSSKTPAVLRFPVVPTLVNAQTVPTWTYDKQNGYWLEDNTAISENGSFTTQINEIDTFALLSRTAGAMLTVCVENIDGEAIAGANVVVSTADWRSNTAQTDSEGQVIFDNVLAREGLTITASKKPNTPQVRSIVLSEGEAGSLIGNCISLSSEKERQEKREEEQKEQQEKIKKEKEKNKKEREEKEREEKEKREDLNTTR